MPVSPPAPTNVVSDGADLLATFTDTDGTRYKARQLAGTSDWFVEGDGPVEAILAYGQSNTLAAGYADPDTLGALFPNTVVMLPCGPTWTIGDRRGVMAESFVPLEVPAGTASLPGVMDSFAVERLARDAGRAPPGLYHFTVGVSGQRIAAFLRGRPTYEALLDNVMSAKEVAQRYDRALVVRAVLWTQGENSSEGYAGDLRQLIDSLQRDIKAITGQPHPPEFMIRQTSGADFGNTAGDSAQAQFEVARERVGHGVTLVGPLYQGAMSDRRHYTTEARMMFADIAARALEAVRKGEVYRPVWPLTLTRSGKVIDVRFNVRGSGLRFDRDLVPASTAEGFQFKDAAGVIPIASVNIAAPDTVRITLNHEPAGAAATLSYAMVDEAVAKFSGPRGSLYSQEDGASTVYGRMGFAVPMHPRHYAVRFILPVK